MRKLTLAIWSVLLILTKSAFCQNQQIIKAIEQQEKGIREHRLKIAPTINLANDTVRQIVVAAGTDSIYQGHPTTVMLPDGKTLYAVWTIKHAGFCGPMKKSTDGGKTWSSLLRVPGSWYTVKNCPAIYKLADPAGKQRLVVFAGSGPINEMYEAYSDDLGETWSEMKPNGVGPASMPFCTIAPVQNGKKLIAMTNFRRPGEKAEKKSCVLVESESGDGGLTWTRPKVILDIQGLKVCEPQIIRSPSGKQLLCLMRENAKRTSLYMTSEDEGVTWSQPLPVPFGLSGDRHQAKYMADGRLVITFRDTGKGTLSHLNFTAWVGHYDDIINGLPGQYRFNLLNSHKGGDCGYSGLEVLPNQTLVATTYIKYKKGSAQNSVVTVRWNLDEFDNKSK